MKILELPETIHCIRQCDYNHCYNKHQSDFNYQSQEKYSFHVGFFTVFMRQLVERKPVMKN